MYDTKIDIHVPVKNYYSDAVRGVKCIKEMEKIMSLDTFILSFDLEIFYAFFCK